MKRAWLTNHGAELECSAGARLLQECRVALREWLASPARSELLPRFMELRGELSWVAPEKMLRMPGLSFLSAYPDRVTLLYDGCPECGNLALEALTWESEGSAALTVGCWDCGWHLGPGGEVRQAPDNPMPHPENENQLLEEDEA
ncbi:MAG TPA: hypothetical protein PK490_12320 [Prosthecobacter sp.]|nr:hypothetical protein [Prosthecobacter sp.]HRK15072.1 hypothetical protein [Prosthecobacter sp.]